MKWEEGGKLHVLRWIFSGGWGGFSWTMGSSSNLKCIHPSSWQGLEKRLDAWDITTEQNRAWKRMSETTTVRKYDTVPTASVIQARG